MLQKRMRTVRIAALLLAALALLGCAKGGGVDSERFDFGEIGNDGLPLGWTVQSFENQYTATLENGVVTLKSDVADDCRLLHTVAVAGGTRYVLSAELSTEGVQGGEGATLSIDNYAKDGSYIYSKGLFGTNDWRSVELAFETDKKQDAVQIALRLGGYSSVSSGTVRFRNVLLEQRDEASVAFQRLTVRSTQKNTSEEKSDEAYEAFFTLLFWATVIVAALLLFGVYRNRERLMNRQTEPKQAWIAFGFFVLIGLVIRLVLCKAFKGHATDMTCWISWGNQIADGLTGGNLSAFYDGTWYDYPPGYMLVLGVLTLVMRVFGVETWGSETLRLFWYMLPAFLCDIAGGILIVRFAKERHLSEAAGLLLGGLIVLNPAAVYLSGAWAQIDSILTLLLLLTYGSFRKGRRIGAALLYAAAVLVKWQALIYGPVLGMVYLATLYEKRGTPGFRTDTIKTAVAVVAALLVIFVVSLPFMGSMGPLWIVDRFLSASSGYDYATVEGYNFFALLGANWRAASADLFNGAGVGGALLAATDALGKLLVVIGAVLLGISLYGELLQRSGRIAQIGTVSAAALCLLFHALTYLVPETEPFAWTFYGAVVLSALGGVYAKAASDAGGLKKLLMTDERALYGLLTGCLAAAVTLGTWMLWLPLHLFGITLTYRAFGTIGIALAVILTAWLLLRYRKAGRLNESDPELLYTLSAFFMLWVFTFGQYMHERYVFPVLFLLLFAFAANRDRRFLLCALLLTVTTFLNETVAMYVVSKGAIDAIRGGTMHNRFLTACSAMETAAALYFTVVCVFGAIRPQKKGERA